MGHNPKSLGTTGVDYNKYHWLIPALLVLVIFIKNVKTVNCYCVACKLYLRRKKGIERKSQKAYQSSSRADQRSDSFTVVFY